MAASDEHLMLAAELQGMKKLHSDGFYHEVTTQDFDNFEGHGAEILQECFLLFLHRLSTFHRIFEATLCC